MIPQLGEPITMAAVAVAASSPVCAAAAVALVLLRLLVITPRWLAMVGVGVMPVLVPIQRVGRFIWPMVATVSAVDPCLIVVVIAAAVVAIIFVGVPSIMQVDAVAEVQVVHLLSSASVRPLLTAPLPAK